MQYLDAILSHITAFQNHSCNIKIQNILDDISGHIKFIQVFDKFISFIETKLDSFKDQLLGLLGSLAFLGRLLNWFLLLNLFVLGNWLFWLDFTLNFSFTSFIMLGRPRRLRNVLIDLVLFAFLLMTLLLRRLLRLLNYLFWSTSFFRCISCNIFCLCDEAERMIFLINFFVIALGRGLILLLGLRGFALFIFWGLVSGPPWTCAIVEYFWLVNLLIIFLWLWFGVDFLLLWLGFLFFFKNLSAFPTSSSYLLFFLDDLLLLWHDLFFLFLLMIRECLVPDYWYVNKKYTQFRFLRYVVHMVFGTNFRLCLVMASALFSFFQGVAQGLKYVNISAVLL